MSLNGLDNPAVIEVYQTALAEAGGWFLLRYVSRDEVALLDRGTGGVPDVRNAIDNYEEKSPLYGFLQYRRRKVVLSYLPEGMSRLLQARTTVQFQSVLDKFSPHDTVFSVAQPTDLTESALSSACLLHTASGSITSSSSSLRRRRLKEIAEDAEENTVGKDEAQMQSPTDGMRQRSFSQLSEATVVPPSAVSSVQQPPVADEPSSKTSESVSLRERSPSVARSERAPSHKSFHDDASYASSEPRKSSQSARPFVREIERAGGRTTKVKLGPRPSVDGSGRPRTAGNLSRSAERRPVASLPAGVRSSSLRRANPSPSRPRSQGGNGVPVSSKVPAVPPLLVPPLSMPISRPKVSPGAKSLSALSSSTTSQEKERLMKALQMRKTQMEKRAKEGKNSPKIEKGDVAQLDATENKENISHIQVKMKHDGAEDRAVHLAGPDKEPLSETQPTVVRDQGADEQPSPPNPPDDTCAVDETGSGSPEQTHDDPSIDGDEFQAGAPRSEPETQTGDRDLGVSNSGGATGGPSSPRLPSVIAAPLENNSGMAPVEEIAGPSPPKPVHHPLVPGEQEVQIIDQDNTTQSEADRFDSISRSDSPLESLPSTSTPIASSIAAPPPPEPQHDLTPESWNVERQHSTRKEKRKPYLEPIQVPTPDYSDDENLLSDDSFMEELKSATVEEAKPISVGVSPLSPGYSNSSNGKVSPDAWRNSRAVSNPSAIGHQPPSMPTAMGRSVSTTAAEASATQNAPVLVARKINVSSGISSRIKALEKFSSTRDAPSTTNSLAPSAASFESLRKGYSDASSRPLSSYIPETFSRASSVRRPNSQAGPGLTRSASSVSVTARIVRDPIAAEGDSTDPSEPAILNLQPSQITVEHETTEVHVLPSLDTEPAIQSEDDTLPPSTAGSDQQSSESVQRPESRISISPSIKEEEASPAKSDDAPSTPESQKQSRATRLLRRMSSITSRKSVVGVLNPIVKGEGSNISVKIEEPERVAPSVTEAAPAIDIGEVNVQFPDTLLWKRRFVRIDDQGYLVLTPGNVDSSNRNLVKRYHMSEFRTPCLPDEDRQELPNSILLDFLDGNTLQCACESRQGQTFVLQTLVDAHSTYHTAPQ
ncbi:GPI-anchored cell surface glyco protein [Aspergillus sclerotioniger CBS 115572]|uniref:GPI-anchored cell surface glyco protein n=1 Tax=Aspergillus sclerotioniger CBS 115572 TaxID=1450535 RepID=A0A317XHI4_9EURO|nr:GPI-anchored cell surface glyco protein [Aspergillus sclerotioniger CBS 115572]PWY96640.1 GPI-anchored cell surface glyco protein [Aspergillus sclerotioniger CBS 115572]